MPETDFHIVPKRPQASKVVNGASEKSSSTTTNDVKSSGEVVEHNEKIVKVGFHFSQFLILYNFSGIGAVSDISINTQNITA